MKKKCDTCSNEVKATHARCSTCKSREWREKNPIRSCYNNLKKNTKRRNKGREKKIEVRLTFEEFKEWAVRTEYIKKKGRTREAWTIDRKDNDGHYELSNIRPMPNHLNASKYTTTFTAEWCPYEQEMRFRTTTKIKETNYEDVPF